MAKKLCGEYGNGISVAWAPANQAYLVLFGSGPIDTRQVLRVINAREDLLYYLRATLGIAA